MKHLSAAALLCLFACLLVSCKQGGEEPKPAVPLSKKVYVTFENKVGDKALVLGPLSYSNAAGNTFSVSMLKYYVSDFTFVKADGTEVHSGNHELIDASDSASRTFVLDSVENVGYTAVKFYLGVDSARNHSGAQDGALDPVHGMIWSWNTGYIFFKHEGNFIDSAGATKPLIFHLGTDAALATITVPIHGFSTLNGVRSLPIIFDLAGAYAAPDKINFNYDNNHMSTTFADAFWISSMKANLTGAFKAGLIPVE